MIWVMDVFLVPAYLAMALVLGAGISGILSLIKNLYREKPVRYAALAMVFLLPVWNFYSNFHKCSQDKYFYAYDFGKNITRCVDSEGSVVLLEGDYAVMPQMYFKYVEKNLDFCPVTTLFISTDWGLKNLKRDCPWISAIYEPQANYTQKIEDIIALNYKEREIYVSIFRQAFQEFYKAGDNFMVPNGVLMKYSTDRTATLKRSEINFKRITYRNLIDDKLYMDSSTKFCISNYASAYMEEGNAFRNLRMDDKSLLYLTRAIALAPEQNRAEAYTHAGIEYSTINRYNDAVEAYQKALAIKPGLIEARSNLAGTYNILKEYDKAIEQANAAIKINDKFSEAYNNLAIAYYYKGNKQEAINVLEKAVAIDPNNAMAQNNLKILKGQK
jgi:tetratricopeptide (TPR) repeat protein